MTCGATLAPMLLARSGALYKKLVQCIYHAYVLYAVCSGQLHVAVLFAAHARCLQTKARIPVLQPSRCVIRTEYRLLNVAQLPSTKGINLPKAPKVNLIRCHSMNAFPIFRGAESKSSFTWRCHRSIAAAIRHLDLQFRRLLPVRLLGFLPPLLRNFCPHPLAPLQDRCI